MSSDYIHEVGTHDVLCGRGAKANNNEGNKLFRQLVKQHKIRYIAAAKVDKPNVAREVVKLWRALVPPGRFLMKVPLKMDDVDRNDELWYDVGDDRARMKASQCLREKTPDVMPYVKMLKSHNNVQNALTLSTPASASEPSNTNQLPVNAPTSSTIPAPVAADASAANACLNIGNGFLPLAHPAMGMNFPSYLLNYQNLGQLMEREQKIQKEAIANGETNVPHFLGAGPLALSNVCLSNMANNANATQVILNSFYNQQLPASMNNCTQTIPQLHPFTTQNNSEVGLSTTTTRQVDANKTIHAASGHDSHDEEANYVGNDTDEETD